MTKLPPDFQGSRRLVAVTELLKATLKAPNRRELDEGLLALRTQVSADARRQRRFSVWSRAAFAALSVIAVVATAIVLHQRSMTPPPALVIERIEGGKLLHGGYLSASSGAGVTLFFGDGSEFALAPKTRGRLRSINPDGAHLAIDQGTASFRITHNPRHRWAIEAGPFLVTVKGTEFTVFWDASSERFEVRLKQGRVSVRGPVLGDDLVLRAGQRLSVSLPRAEVVISEDSAESSADPAPAVASSPTQTKPPSGEPAVASSAPSALRWSAAPVPSAPRPSSLASERDWSAAMANGQWDRILEDAERVGVDKILESASSADLSALADAARYRRRAELARVALLAQRRRFPESPRSVDALFLLGRVEESRKNRALAIPWYDEYLVRAPAGTYASEALGRKMILTDAVQGPESAKKLATEYLRRFPNGSYAGTARAFQRAP